MFMKSRIVVIWILAVVSLMSPAWLEAQQQPPQEPPQEFGSEDVMTAAPVMPPFDPKYLVGEWEIEWAPPEFDLFPGGKYTGIERVTEVGTRYLKVEVELAPEQGDPVKGQGIILIDQGLSGVQMLKYVAFDRGFALYQVGPIGLDLNAASSYKHTWEVPEFTFMDVKYTLKGNSSFLSPAAYRVNQQISMDGANLMSFGILWYTKRDAPAEAAAAPAR